MMYGITFSLEMLPGDVPAGIVPGIGCFQAGAAALKASPPYGYGTNGVILTMKDWARRLHTAGHGVAATQMNGRGACHESSQSASVKVDGSIARTGGVAQRQ